MSRYDLSTRRAECRIDEVASSEYFMLLLNEDSRCSTSSRRGLRSSLLHDRGGRVTGTPWSLMGGVRRSLIVLQNLPAFDWWLTQPLSSKTATKPIPAIFRTDVPPSVTGGTVPAGLRSRRFRREGLHGTYDDAGTDAGDAAPEGGDRRHR